MNRLHVPRPGAGFTLVEILVAMALVATLTTAGLAALARANGTWRAQAADQRRYERAQYVFGTFEPELQMAGFFGPPGPPSPLPAAAVPVPVLSCGADIIGRLDQPVARLATLPPACVARGALATGSDVLVVRRASAQVSPPRAGRAQWLIPRQGPGRVLWDGQVPSDIPNPELRDLIVRIYYVARTADGDPHTPALRVKTLTEVAGAPAFIDTEVMPGVEFLQAQLLPAGTTRSVRIALRIRADDGEERAQDARRTLSVTRHFTLRNVPPDAT
jgi:prepilin-type N-terminal cleavage/methylation domain-containing protein